MIKSTALLGLLLLSLIAIAGPVPQMNKAFHALTGLSPYLVNEDKFKDPKNEAVITSKLNEISEAFKTSKHNDLIKHDLFAPSYKVITEQLSDTTSSFKKGQKGLAYWQVTELTSMCIDCHSRLPVTHASSFQHGELSINESKFQTPYEKGVANLVVRRFFDAKASFTRDIQDRIINKDMKDILLPFKQILLIQLKVEKDPKGMLPMLNEYSKRKLPKDVLKTLNAWKTRITKWEKEKFVSHPPRNDKEMQEFINNRLKPLKAKPTYEEAFSVDLLLASGILSGYFFENQNSKLAPELSYWLGWTEKRLKREQFYTSGESFLKQCIKRYPKSSVAKDCFEEYKESVEFGFSGSAGKNVPEDLQNELKRLKGLIKK